jgi:hypothetical protein
MPANEEMGVKPLPPFQAAVVEASISAVRQ